MVFHTSNRDTVCMPQILQHRYPPSYRPHACSIVSSDVVYPLRSPSVVLQSSCQRSPSLLPPAKAPLVTDTVRDSSSFLPLCLLHNSLSSLPYPVSALC